MRRVLESFLDVHQEDGSRRFRGVSHSCYFSSKIFMLWRLSRREMWPPIQALCDNIELSKVNSSPITSNTLKHCALSSVVVILRARASLKWTLRRTNGTPDERASQHQSVWPHTVLNVELFPPKINFLGRKFHITALIGHSDTGKAGILKSSCRCLLYRSKSSVPYGRSTTVVR